MRGRLAGRIAGIVLLLAGAALLTVAHGEKEWTAPPEAKALKNPLEATPPVLQAGAEIFQDKCTECHGEKGKGDGPDAAMYDTPPGDLTQTEMMTSMTDGEIFWKISEGRRPMPSFKKKLTEEQRWQVVLFVRTLAPKPPAPEKPAKAPSKKSASKKP